MGNSARIAGEMALVLATLACTDSSGPRVGTVPSRITVLDGVSGVGYVAGTKIPTPIVVQVTDYSGLPVPNVELSFLTAGGGWITPDPVITDGEGEASFYWNLGNEVGPNSLLISVASSPSIQAEITTTTIVGAVAFLFMGPPAATLAEGSTLQLVANAADANFNTVPGVAISWVSSNETAVSVSSSGLLTALAPGTAVIAATAQSAASAYSTVTVPVPAGPNGPGIPPFTMAITAKNDNAIRVIRSDGTVESTVSCGSQCIFLAGPNWSRDGSKFAATGRRDTESVLFVVNRDGTDLHEVASTSRYPVTIGGFTSWYWPEFNEDWSGDGRLVYVRQTQTTRSIETVAADGSGRTTVVPAANPGFGNVRWGLGDTMITAEMGGQIYAMNPDGSNVRQLTSVAASAFDHRWSPDGKTIAFSSSTGSPTQGMISILDPASGSVRQIVVPRLRGFCWSPNSSQLSLVSLENELQGWLSIYTVNADGTGIRRAVIAILDIFNPVIGAWSPDGKFLVYLDDRTPTGVPGAGQLYAQSISEGTNTRLSDVGNVIFFSIAETRGCGRSFQYP